MLDFIVHMLASAAMIMVVAHVVPGVKVSSYGAAIVAALVLGVVNAVVKPIAVVLSLPFIFLTLGLFLVPLNALLLKLVAALTPGFKIEGVWPAVLGSILLWLLNSGVDKLLS